MSEVRIDGLTSGQQVRAGEVRQWHRVERGIPHRRERIRSVS